eukprot:CAMPEP_0198202018 /NCGR_PEP_ID=MMETSP1445-20131203/5069_1 /TAXON_ID=36898 /ORGANISM="Pyramimonas sp., Strain CCMP2087" /LENGTH=138 /DNA_ID=CAMNT_0043872721 /DNA_START=61 /DNA_END=480 /DNA_ORIENTATION=+
MASVTCSSLVTIPRDANIFTVKTKTRVTLLKARRVVRVSAEAEASRTELPPGACKGCGRLEGPKGGCNGEGRIPGGMTAILSMANKGKVPDWWPIKIYRPCPVFIEAGNAYQAGGQSVDDIFFGGGTSTRDFLGGKDD